MLGKMGFGRTRTSEVPHCPLNRQASLGTADEGARSLRALRLAALILVAHTSHFQSSKVNPSNSKLKKYIPLALSREMYKWGSENG